MSNPDKHKPLSPEELLKLLEQKSDKARAFNDFDIDDFEKEALEGFSSHAKNSIDAKRMMDEINVSISEEVADNAEKSRKYKIIWFSAAASLAVIIIISAVFFKQTDVTSNIALNEGKEKVADPVELKDNTVFDESSDAEKSKENQTLTQEPIRVLPIETKITNEVISNNNVASGSTKMSQVQDVTSGEGNYGKAEQKNKMIVAEDANIEAVAANTSVYDKISEKQLDDVRNESLTTDYKKEEETKQVESAPMKHMDADFALAKNVAESEEKSKSNAGAKAKAESEAKNKAKKEAAKADESMAGGVVNTAVPASTGYITNTSAYYVGGELGIRNYVLNYLKEHKESVALKGKFKVKASVNEKGVLKVNTIENTSNDCKECITPITKALNSMTNWKSAIQNNNSVSSETEFMLFF